MNDAEIVAEKPVHLKFADDIDGSPIQVYIPDSEGVERREESAMLLYGSALDPRVLFLKHIKKFESLNPLRKYLGVDVHDRHPAKLRKTFTGGLEIMCFVKPSCYKSFYSWRSTIANLSRNDYSELKQYLKN